MKRCGPAGISPHVWLVRRLLNVETEGNDVDMASDPSHNAPTATPWPQPHGPGAWPAVRQSADRLARHENAFIRQLRYDVNRLMPDSATPPALDTWLFCERMVRLLLWAALTDESPHVVADTIRQVGAQNWYDGFPDAQYANVAHALVQTVHYLSGHDWSASTGSAWISYFMWIKPHLLTGAQRAAAQHTAAQRAAERREAARGEALSRDSHGAHARVVGDVNLESRANLLDEDDDEDVGYVQIMASMTRNPRREPPRHRR